jgi:hypothetical protein
MMEAVARKERNVVGNGNSVWIKTKHSQTKNSLHFVHPDRSKGYVWQWLVTVAMASCSKK